MLTHCHVNFSLIHFPCWSVLGFVFGLYAILLNIALFLLVHPWLHVIIWFGLHFGPKRTTIICTLLWISGPWILCNFNLTLFTIFIWFFVDYFCTIFTMFHYFLDILFTVKSLIYLILVLLIFIRNFGKILIHFDVVFEHVITLHDYSNCWLWYFYMIDPISMFMCSLGKNMIWVVNRCWFPFG